MRLVSCLLILFVALPLSGQEIRAEAFNLTKTPWFGSPSTSLASANAGVVTPNQSNDPRNVQLALRLVFWGRQQAGTCRKNANPATVSGCTLWPLRRAV